MVGEGLCTICIANIIFTWTAHLLVGGVQGEGLLRGVTEGGGDRKEGLALP